MKVDRVTFSHAKEASSHFVDSLWKKKCHYRYGKERLETKKKSALYFKQEKVVRICVLLLEKKHYTGVKAGRLIRVFNWFIVYTLSVLECTIIIGQNVVWCSVTAALTLVPVTGLISISSWWSSDRISHTYWCGLGSILGQRSNPARRVNS